MRREHNGNKYNTTHIFNLHDIKTHCCTVTIDAHFFKFIDSFNNECAVVNCAAIAQGTAQQVVTLVVNLKTQILFKFQQCKTINSSCYVILCVSMIIKLN